MDTDKHQCDLRLGALKRVVGAATAFSAACCVALLLLIPLSFLLELPSIGSGGDIDPKGAVSVGSLSVVASGGNLWLYTGELPYRGSIITTEGMWDGVSVSEQLDWGWDYRRIGFGQVSYIDQTGSSAGLERYGDFPGLYYRYFRWRSSQYPWWTLRLGLFFPIALTAILPTWWLTKKFGEKRRLMTSTLPIATILIALFLSTAATLK